MCLCVNRVWWIGWMFVCEVCALSEDCLKHTEWVGRTQCWLHRGRLRTRASHTSRDLHISDQHTWNSYMFHEVVIWNCSKWFVLWELMIILRRWKNDLWMQERVLKKAKSCQLVFQGKYHAKSQMGTTLNPTMEFVALSRRWLGRVSLLQVHPHQAKATASKWLHHWSLCHSKSLVRVKRSICCRQEKLVVVVPYGWAFMELGWERFGIG